MQDTRSGVSATLRSVVNIATSPLTVHISKDHKCFGVWPEHNQ
jgi:hypothetical protein